MAPLKEGEEKTNVGWVSQIYDILWVWFSQSNLQKGPVLPPKTLQNFYTKQGYQHFFQKIDIGSHNVNS